MLSSPLLLTRPAPATRSRGYQDRSHTHRCISCGVPLGRRHQRPAGEIRAAGIWGDACPQCHLQHHLLQDDTQPPPTIFRPSTQPL